jgi:hypothetical protein
VIVDKSESDLDLDPEENEWEVAPPNDNSGHKDLNKKPMQVEQSNQEASVIDVRSM